jgi:xylulokinase
MNRAIICADIGTTSLKTAIVDGNGEVVSFSQQFFSLYNDNYIALAWLPAFCRAVAEMCKPHTSSTVYPETILSSLNICGICISGNGPTITAENGRTLLWNTKIDTNLTDNTNAAHSLFLPRIAAFLRLYPDIRKSGQQICSGPEFLIKQLTGNAVTILPEERYRTAYWTDEQLASAAIERSLLPVFVPPATSAGNLLPEITKRFGLPHTIPVFCGGPDFIAAMVGTNSLSAGKWYDCAGSSEGLNLCTVKPLYSNGILLLPSLITGLWNAAALKAESGCMFENYKQIIEAIYGRSVSYSELISSCLSHPENDGYEVLELIAENFRQMVSVISRTAAANNIKTAPYIIVTGGQAKNPRWMQMKCNAADIPLAVCNCADSELIGDAVMAQTGLGTYHSLQEAAQSLVKIKKIYEPGAQP